MREDWKEYRLREIIILNYGKALKEEDRIEGSIPVYSSAGITGFHNEAFVNSNGLILGRKGTIGKVYKSDVPFCCIDTAYYILPNKKYNLNFIYYLFHILGLDEMNNDSAVPGLNRNTVYFQKIYLPLLPEQHAISNYLDKKLSVIDNHISLLEKKRDTYKRLRKNLINQTVRLGLNPDVETKDSGIEWLGEIPKHWEVKRVKDVAKNIGSGSTPSSDNERFYDNGTIPWINTGDLNDSFITENKKNITDLAYKSYPILKYFYPETVIIALYGATIGKLGILTYKATVNQACCCITLYDNYFYKYLYYNLLCSKDEILKSSFGGTQPNISQKVVSNILVSIPPLTEQQAIVNYLDIQTQKIDNILQNINGQLGKLAQLKKSLINETVTGNRNITTGDTNIA